MSSSEDLAEVYGGPFESRPSIFLHVEEGIKKNPQGTAVIVAHQSPAHLSELVADSDGESQQNGPRTHACLSWTYTQLQRAALRLASGLTALGVQPESTMVTLIPNGVESLLVLYTAAIMRLTLTPLDAGALTKPRREELVNFMQTLKPDIIVVPNASASKTVDAAIRESAAPSSLLGVQLDGKASEPDRWTTISALVENALKHPLDEYSLLEKARSYDPERVALIMFTSGTSSGKPKGCPRRVGGIAQFYDIQTWGPDFGPSSSFLFSTANFRIIAPSVVAAVWKAGGTVVMPGPAFGPEIVLDAIEQHGITHLVLLPAQIHALAAHPTFKNRKRQTVQNVFSGGDMLTRDLFVTMAASFPGANVCAAHGMTEGGALFAWPFFDTPLSDIPYWGEISPLGTVAKGARIRIWDHETGKPATRGQAGELHVCNNVTIRHYLGGVHEDSFYEDELGRWFKTGDLGLINEDDVIYILGRMKDVIKRAGVPITPAALESSIGKFTGASTAVIAIPSSIPGVGQEAFAILQDFNGKSEDQVKQCVVDLFGNDYQLAGAASLKQLGLDTFPLNATGKIMKIELQKIVEEHLQRQR